MIDKQLAINIDKQQLLSHFGYGDDYQPSVRIKSLVNDYIENYHNLIDFSYSYLIRDIESVQENRVSIEDSITLESKVISRLLKRCEAVAIFVLTIGNHLEDMVAYLAEHGLVLQATVLDAIGSGTAEQLAGLVEDKIRESATARGLVISQRFSPGYCDWDVSQQEMIFKAIPEGAGVRLTEAYLMLPRKSISGIIGIGSSNNDIDNYNPCKSCRAADCPGRRA